jgi:hypothetical protein
VVSPLAFLRYTLDGTSVTYLKSTWAIYWDAEKVPYYLLIISNTKFKQTFNYFLSFLHYHIFFIVKRRHVYCRVKLNYFPHYIFHCKLGTFLWSSSILSLSVKINLLIFMCMLYSTHCERNPMYSTLSLTHFWSAYCKIFPLHPCSDFSLNHLTPNGHFSGRTAPLSYRCCTFLFIQQIYILNILNMLHTLRVFLFKMSFISSCYLFWFLYYSHFIYRVC